MKAGIPVELSPDCDGTSTAFIDDTQCIIRQFSCALCNLTYNISIYISACVFPFLSKWCLLSKAAKGRILPTSVIMNSRCIVTFRSYFGYMVRTHTRNNTHTYIHTNKHNNIIVQTIRYRISEISSAHTHTETFWKQKSTFRDSL